MAIVLDFDGVIVDSLAAHLEAWAQAVQQIFQCRLEAPETIATHATRTIGAILAARFGDASQAASLVAAKERALCETHVPPLFEGVLSFIEAAQRRKIPWGIASNSRRDYVHATLARHQLKAAVTICGDEVSRAKPHPDMLWACTNALGIERQQRERVLAFDDAVHGLAAAHAAGMCPVGVASSLDANTLRHKSQAQYIVPSLGEALWLLEGP